MFQAQNWFLSRIILLPNISMTQGWCDSPVHLFVNFRWHTSAKEWTDIKVENDSRDDFCKHAIDMLTLVGNNG